MNIENYEIGFLNTSSDIMGVIIFLIVRYGYKEESYISYYKRKDLKFKSYGR